MASAETSAKVRVSDYIASRLADHGVRHVFLVTGGGAMHLNDAFGREKRLNYVACHHEQACAMAAESYTRMTGRLCAVNVTTGPGGTNAITGVWGAWVDSIPMVVISGQVKWETVVRSTGLPLRQMGDQELDIVKVVEPITKLAMMVTDPESIRYHLEKALYLAESGRPGPVWLDIPMNVQGALIDPKALKAYNHNEDSPHQNGRTRLTEVMPKILQKLKESKRPVVFAGSGVRVSGMHAKFIALVESLGIPVVTGFNAHDAIWNDHPLYIGRAGLIGDRPGNYAVQSADFLLVLGSRLSIRQVSYAWKAFAREAYKVMVDIDEAELKKPTLSIDLPVHANLKEFIPAFSQALLDEKGGYRASNAHQDYLKWCRERKERYPVVLPEYWTKEAPVNPYCFTEALFKQLPENESIVTGDGTACVVTFQAANLKKGQRLYHNSGCASMGYDLPAAIGACFALEKKRVICLAGDGSIQMNLQELQTVVSHRLPLKIFIFNNQGYHSIRQTQQAYFPDNVVGCGEESGLNFPSFEKIAFAYGIPFRRIDSHSEMAEKIRQTIDGDGPQICEVYLDLKQQFAPKLSSRKLEDGRMISAPLEDLAPFLPREELAQNLLIKPWEG